MRTIFTSSFARFGRVISNINRLGAAVVLTLAAALLAASASQAATIYVSNSGDNTITKFTDGVGSVFASTNLNFPEGLALDGAGNLYVANRGNNTIMKFTPGGVGSLFASTNLNAPEGLAFDSAGNLFVANIGGGTIMKFTPGGVGSLFASVGMPAGLAFDTLSNLFATTAGNTITKFTPDGVGSFFAQAGAAPGGLAFDTNGNLYVGNGDDNTIGKFTPGGVGSIFANTNLSGPEGIAFDNAGNLYVVNNHNNTVTAFTPGGVGSTFASSGLSVPTFIAVYSPSNTCVSAPSGLVGWWKGENNALDSAGTNNGTLMSGLTFTNGQVGQAFHCDPSSGTVRLSVPDNPAFILTNALTIEGWIRPTAASHVIFWRGDNRVGLDPYVLSMDGNEVLAFQMSQSATEAAEVRATLAYNQWFHVAATWDAASGLMKLYVNGALATQTNTTLRPLGALDPARDPSIGIGNVGSLNNDFPFVGDIDEISLYGRALSESEIQSIYNAGSLGKCVQPPPPPCATPFSGLVSWWKGEGNGMDQVGTNNGTLTGGITFAPGEVGQAFALDGMSNCVLIPSSASLNPTGAFSVEVWIKADSNQFSADGLFLIVDKSHGWGQADGWLLQGNLDGTVAFGFGIGGPDAGPAGFPVVTTLTSVLDNHWHHLAGVFTGTELQIYLDAVLQNTRALTTLPAGNNRAVEIGRSYSGYAGVPSRFFHGLIDEASFYSRALATNEIQSIYNAGSAGKCVPPPPPPPCVTPPSGLVSWWKGENNALDSVGTNNGTLVGNTTYGSARVGQGFVLDGTDDGVRVGNPAELRLQNFSIEAWIKRASTSLVTGSVGNNAVFFSYGSGGYGFGLFADGRLVLSQIDSDALLTAATVNDTNFHHVAVTKTGTTVIFYLDGVAYPAAVYGSTFVFSTVAAVGARGDNLFNSFLGTVDEVSVYNRALAGSEVQAIYNAGGSGKCLIPPAIVAQPQNQTVVVGQTATFSVTATGSQPLSYQWQKNSAPIFGATSATYAIVNAQTNDSGTYSVIITNSLGSTNSSNAILLVTPTTCPSSPGGLVAWWPAEGAGGDSIGGHDATLLNGATYGTGEVGQGFSLDGVDDRIVVADSPALNFGTTGDFSIEAWIKAFPKSSSYNVISIVDKRQTQNASGAVGYVFYLDSGRLSCQLDPAPGGSYYSFNSPGPNLQDGVFHHVAMSAHRQSAAGGKLYVDGQVVLTFDTTIGAGDVSNTGPLRIGNHADLPLDCFFKGVIDEPSLYNRALSGAEVQMIYNAGTAGKCGTPTPPTITLQPTNQTVAQGSVVTFYVAASGSSPLSYQWQKNGTPISGATSATYAIVNAQTNDSGTYSVIITNSLGSTNSSDAILLVTPTTCASPPGGLVAWWPAEGSVQDVVSSNNATLLNGATYGTGKVGQGFSLDGVDDRIVVADSPALNFGTTGDFSIEAWIKAFPKSSSYNVISIVDKRQTQNASGAVGYSFYLDSGRLSCQLDPAPGGSYYSFNSPGPNLQDGVFHHVAMSAHRQSAAGGKLYVDGQVVLTFDTTIGAGDVSNTGAFRIGNHADLPLDCFFKGIIDELTIYNRSLSTSEIQSIYNAGASGKCGTNFAPFITANPTNQTVIAGGTTMFAVQAGGTQPLSYQWQKNGSDLSDGGNVSGATGSALNLSAISLGDAGTYDVIVANAAGSITSALTVLTVIVPPGIVTQPQSQTNNTGATVAFNILASGNFLTYRWSKNGSPMTSGGNISGATSSSLTLANISQTDAASYTGTITNVAGSATSAAATLTVLDSPAIALQPISRTNNAGTTATFSVSATGTTPLSYQWQKDGSALTGETGDTLTIINVQSNNIGNYSVVVSNVLGSVTSSNAYLNVLPLVVAVNASGQSGTDVVVPIHLIALGNENALSFSLWYDTNLLTYSGVVLGSNVSGGQLFSNTNSVGSGALGVAIAVAPGASFPGGAQEVARVSFGLKLVTNLTVTTVAFSDSPTARLLVDAQSHALMAAYQNAAVTLTAAALEADVSPRTDGDYSVNIADWVQVGRFVAGLDTVSNANEFMRADCAPRTNHGNGILTTADWVQAARYAVGIDPLVPADGPSSFAPQIGKTLLKSSTDRALDFANAVVRLGQTNSIQVQLESKGNENAMGFSISYNSSVMQYTGASLGGSATAATLVVNTNQAGSGRVGFLLALPVGQTFASGAKQVLDIQFVSLLSSSTNATIDFADLPIIREVTDTGANSLACNYNAATVLVNPVFIPSLNIFRSNDNVWVSWPTLASDFSLQWSVNLSSNWSNSAASKVTNGSIIKILEPLAPGPKFYRLAK